MRGLQNTNFKDMTSCCKISFPSKNLAKKRIKSMKRAGNWRSKYSSVYRCKFCGQYHISGHPPKSTVPNI